MTFTNHSNSPAIFREWVAITTIGAALQRKVHLLIQGEPLFCNFYTVLVSPPGIGKTRAIRFGRRLLAGLPEFQLSADSVTKEKLYDVLTKSTKVSLGKAGEMISQTALACFLDELSTFIKANDVDFMTVLTALFDCPTTWLYQTVSRGDVQIENLFLSICGGITPKSIQRNWGEGAIGMGFTARLNLIYSEDGKPIDLFSKKTELDFGPLIRDLRQIHDLTGQMRVEPKAAEMLQSWVSAGMPPIPADSRFAEYNPRRSIHWIKLCMVYCIAESNDLIIKPRHVERAKATLLEAERVLPLAFEHLGQNPMLNAINSVHQWMKVEYAINKTPIGETRLRRKLMADVPPQYIDAAINELLSSGLMSPHLQTSGRAFIPVNIRRTE